MDRLTGLDGAFLSLESPTTHLQILGALVFDPGEVEGGVDFWTVRSLVADRLPLVDVYKRQGLTTAVVTFDRHPATVVRPDSAPRLLCDLDQKLELLEAAGVDRTIVVRFDAERANETAEAFVETILVEALAARLVVVGEDFHFGHGRKGNVALLRDMGSAAGFEVDGVSLRALSLIHI